MIYNTISSTEFARWIANSDSYKNNFSYEGANALQDYLEQLSEDLDENIEFDPIAWCCEYSEYKDLEEFNTQYWGEGKNENKFDIEQLKDEAVVIEFDGGIIVQDF
jgi:antirestriction protein